MKTKIIVLLFVTASSIITWAQNESFIVISSDSRVEIPANEIAFSIYLEQTDENAQNAFDALKEQEKKFLPLLKEFEIPDSSIFYSLIQLRKDRAYNNKPNQFVAGETVVIKLYDFKKYEDFQIALLAIDITNFNATLSASEIKTARELGFKKAIESAENEAEIISKNLGRHLGKVLEVESKNRDFVAQPTVQALQSGTVYQSHGLIDIPQNVTLNTSLKIKYELK
jgi:uncharacterized protein YggE